MSSSKMMFEFTPLEAALILVALENFQLDSTTTERARVRVLELLKEVIC